MVQPERQVADETSWPARLVVHAGLVELIVAISLALVALWLWVGSYAFEQGERGLMGAVAFPRGVSLVLGGASLLMLYQAVRQLTTGRGTADPVFFRRPRPVLGVVILVILYPLLLSHFGFYETTGPWLLALLWVIGQRDPIWGVLTTLAFLAVVKFAFQIGMGIPLP